ncbi:dihydrodipicolinate synthase family protein [Amycolatopsis pigmentata]|uniref:Dihydrodipicolinate synthase family protein n=1 Tax=Amycolatopsis pigmentata TaxID=450801 RepID=A0ABW5G5Y0_9PSEU
MPEVIVAVPTPFDATGGVDLAAVKERFAVLGASLDGLFVAGTTGEFPVLSDPERLALFETALSVCPADRVIVHCGGSNATGLTVRARELGARRFAAITPSEDTEVDAYYRRIREAAGDGEVYAYLFPERTGLDLGPERLARLLTDCDLTGAKLSGGAAARFAGYRAAVPEGKRLYSGDDGMLPEMAAGGGAGIVSGVSSAFPVPFADLAAALRTGDDEKVAVLAPRIRRLVAFFAASIPLMKQTWALRGYCRPDTRMAVEPAPPGAEVVLRSFIEEFG